MARARACFLVAVVALLFLPCLHAFYLPGVAPLDLNKGDDLLVKVNKLTSTKTQLPYVYYDLPYCKPNKIFANAENLGEVLRGDRIENSLYKFRMRENELCKLVCRIEKLSTEEVKKFKEKIDDEYRVNMILDNLPVAIKRERHDGSVNAYFYDEGFPVGYKSKSSETGKEDKYFLHNHLSFEVLFHLDPETATSRIVGFEVIPYSINHEYDGPWDASKPKLTTCNQNLKMSIANNMLPQEVEGGQEIIFTYDVSFTESNIKWASRWDVYLNMDGCHDNDANIVPRYCQRWLDDGHAAVMGLYGLVCWLFLCTTIQDVQGGRMEEEHFEDGIFISGCCFCRLLYFECLNLGKPAIEDPVRTNKIPRQVPEQACEDYHWWWRSYLTSGSSAIYLLLYASFYFFTKLEITKLVSGLLYFGYMGIISYCFFVLTGTIGFYACFWFVRIIYASVKID
ncbi:hypothetical protein GOP47_0014675 [Adiantum capillus-veneris]|uniref:Transmembrane 9 superfamily member n=1 Tax=Adiantum capillus-veneris TaxID=13818 RepID=A0A9D4UMS8_ADICA|nr:hypothetical protein GOP47_0014675 [Adiantum capillus-veneris]